MWRLLLGCLLATQFSYVQAAPENDPWLVLQKAAQAARELSYQGVFLYQSGNSSRSVQITHMNYGQGEYARIVVLDGTPREVLSQGNDVVIFSPRNEKVVIEKRRGQNLFPALLPPNVDTIKTSYQVRLGGMERIGGREGQVVYLEPRDKYRYGYKFWADREYGLLLKSMSSNQRDQVVEQMAFNQLTLLNTQSMDWFQPHIDPNKHYVMEDQVPAKPSSADADNWVVEELPAGYKKVDQIKRMAPGKNVPLTHIVFSDGLASVSLFVEPLTKGARAKTGFTSLGATNIHANVVEGHQIMVVGEVPEATVAQIANSVSFKK